LIGILLGFIGISLGLLGYYWVLLRLSFGCEM
jgi:hypothetical protein